jgi:nucleoid DNA-binding protein
MDRAGIPLHVSIAHHPAFSGVVYETAQACGCSTADATEVVLMFMVKLTQAVAQGRSVTIPGIGHFSVMARQNRRNVMRMTERYAYPAFFASANFKAEVRRRCPPSRAVAVEQASKGYARRNVLQSSRRAGHRNMDAPAPAKAVAKAMAQVKAAYRKLGVQTR